tara:strand:- start:2321 stop:2827 length:507 start_codon:yes stop_codon:yes gene_type:complete
MKLSKSRVVGTILVLGGLLLAVTVALIATSNIAPKPAAEIIIVEDGPVGEPQDATETSLSPFSLPGSGDTLAIDQLSIHLKGNGEIWANDKLIETAQSDQKEFPVLREQIKIHNKPQIQLITILSADDAAKGIWFAGILEELSNAGIQNVTLSGFSQESDDPLPQQGN